MTAALPKTSLPSAGGSPRLPRVQLEPAAASAAPRTRVDAKRSTLFKPSTITRTPSPPSMMTSRLSPSTPLSSRLTGGLASSPHVQGLSVIAGMVKRA